MNSDSGEDKQILINAQELMKSGQFAEALTLASSVLDKTPDHQEALYLVAVCARYERKYDQASNSIQKLKIAAPDYGRAFQEEGHLNLALNRKTDALKAFRQATRLNPTLSASWKAIINLSALLTNQNEAKEVRDQLSRIEKLPRELLAVTNHISEGRIIRAEEIARRFLRKNPKHVEGMRLLADIGSRLGAQEDAEFLLESALMIDPSNIQVRMDYIQVLRKRQKFAMALEHAEILLERNTENPVFQSLYAIESMQSGNYDIAIKYFDKILQKLPNDAITLTSKGHALKTMGKTELAIETYREAVKSEPLHGDAWYALANLKTFKFSEKDLQSLIEIQSSDHLTFISKVYIAFALGKAFEDRKDYGKAFENYDYGNTLKSKQTRYTTEQMYKEFDAQKRHCTSDLFEKHVGAGYSATDPIFIVSLPRAGSTLIEQILASHSQVDGTLELPNIVSLAHQLRGREHSSDPERYPRILHEMTHEDLNSLGKEYIDSTQIHRSGAPFFTDKMPNNFRHIGLIHLILPNAKIIDARRNAMDCCWSCYKQLFAEGQEFTYRLEDIAEYYKSYVDLMEHWNTVLPKGKILRVQHENLLDNFEHVVRQILDHCGLKFEQSCVEFHKTSRAVRTASSEQVRRPLNRSGQGQWRAFEQHLSALKSALGDKYCEDL